MRELKFSVHKMAHDIDMCNDSNRIGIYSSYDVNFFKYTNDRYA